MSAGTAVARSSDELITGRRAVAEAIGAGRAIEVLVAPGARRNQGLRAVLGAADRARVPVREVGRADLDQLAGAHPGGVARHPPARAHAACGAGGVRGAAAVPSLRVPDRSGGVAVR